MFVGAVCGGCADVRGHQLVMLQRSLTALEGCRGVGGVGPWPGGAETPTIPAPEGRGGCLNRDVIEITL